MGLSYNVLIVDDDKEVRGLLQSLYSTYGHRSETAQDGIEALEKIKKVPFDAAVVDVVVPCMDGITLTSNLIRLYPDLPIMVMTGYVHEHYEESAIAAGAREFIKKPFSIREFILRFDKMMCNQKSQEALFTLSLTDELTGLSNRRRFFVLTEQCLKVAMRTKKQLLLLFIDMDGLKEINDCYGHAEGDRALKDLAHILNKTFRNSDIVCRFGGDEFVVLSDAGDPRSTGIISRLYGNLDECDASKPRRYPLSISVGTALFDPEHPVSIDALLTRADTMMYAQKSKRKNCAPSQPDILSCY
jgi:diguanylate cyclase (GGDEF)-like protein